MAQEISLELKKERPKALSDVANDVKGMTHHAPTEMVMLTRY